MRDTFSFAIIAAAPFAAGLLAAAAHAAEVPTAGAVLKDCAECPELVVMPLGSYRQGFDGGEPERYEGPVREVTIAKPFAVGKYEVTIAEFDAFQKATGYEQPYERGCVVWDGRNARFDKSVTYKNPEIPGTITPQHPAVCISWDDAKAYLDWMSKKTGELYRLPSEAEWEWIAGEGANAPYPWGEDPAKGCDVANMYDLSAKEGGVERPVDPVQCRDGQPSLAPVGSLKPNAFGLYDIVGNVWEWVEDCYAMPYPAWHPADGSAQYRLGCDRRGVRGGSWTSDATRQRITFRGRDPQVLNSNAFGFRVARDVTAADAAKVQR
jgi:formylglycine-generating enzyme required for sulfatase activity